MQNEEIRLLYVEYSFLGHFGEKMETVSIEKPKTANQEMIYNFRKSKFIICQNIFQLAKEMRILANSITVLSKCEINCE